jgi:hypothetical protein
MTTIVEFWKINKNTIEEKSLQQILAFTGDGKLRDANKTSLEFRELLDNIPSELLIKFANECLIDSFNESGFVLQDIINQIGLRLGFNVQHGLYRGKRNDIGFDGIWTSKDDYSLIIEVKTTDAYRINLDTIYGYQESLIEQKRINKTKSSILIIVGRQDTGDFEAQIRGSKQAWNIRLISTDSLIKLLSLRENLNDSKTLQQINEVLKPLEYTKIDKLIELIFLTSKDIKLSEETEEEIEEINKNDEEMNLTPEKKDKKFKPVNFYDECIEVIQKKLGINLIKQTKISYESKDKKIGLICAISKEHKQGNNKKYWFAFHPHQKEFLKEYTNAFVAYGCGSSKTTILFPYNDFIKLVENMWTTEKEDRMYWHVVIREKDGKLLLAQPNNELENQKQINDYLINREV